jgi:hypothetical protein
MAIFGAMITPCRKCSVSSTAKAVSTASRLPAITCWVGELKLEIVTGPSIPRSTASSGSTSIGPTAAITPAGPSSYRAPRSAPSSFVKAYLLLSSIASATHDV